MWFSLPAALQNHFPPPAPAPRLQGRGSVNRDFLDLSVRHLPSAPRGAIVRAKMQPENREPQAGDNPYAAPAPPSRKALRKAAAKRSARESALFDKVLKPTFIGAAVVTIAPGILGIALPPGLRLTLLLIVGLVGATSASASWPRRVLYSVPFVTITVGIFLGPAIILSGQPGLVPIALFILFSMIGAIPGLLLYGLVRMVVARLHPPRVVD